MKKSIFTLALAAAMSLSASAIPTTFNYQGVAQANATIEVDFTVLCDGVVVYTEEHAGVQTNANGVFTLQVGSADTNGAWDDIDWTAGDYAIVTSIDNIPVSTAVLQAVPYALVAEKCVGHDEIMEGLLITQQDVIDLSETVRGNSAWIAAHDADFNNVLENLEGLTPVIEYLLENAETTADGLATTQGDVIELTEQVRSNTSWIAAHDVDWSNVEENFEGLQDIVNALLESKETLEDGLATTQGDVIELTEQVRSNTAWIAAHDAEWANVSENLEGLVPVIETLVEKVDANEEAIAIVSSDVQGIQESLRGYATVDAVAELEDVVGQVKDMAENFISTFDEEYLTPIQEAFDATNANVDKVANDLAEFIAGQEEYDREYNETVMASFAEADERLRALEEGLGISQQDIIDLSEGLQEVKASISEKYSELLKLIEDNAAAIAALGAIRN